MNTCKKCGAIILDGSRFCGKCGTDSQAPLKTICPHCKNEVADGLIFCNKCGQKLHLPLSVPPDNKTGSITLTIKREFQLQCSNNIYKAIVNGNTLGIVPAGGMITTKLNFDIATVEIKCTSFMINSKLRLVLRLGSDAHIVFSVQPGGILPTVQGAEILEQQNRY